MQIGSILLDLCMVVIFFIIVISSYKKGFLKTVTLAAGTLVSLILAFWLSGYAADFVFTTFVRPSVLQSINEAIVSSGASATVSSVLPAVIAAIPAFFLNPVLAQFGSQEALIQKITSETSVTIDNLGEVITDNVLEPVICALLQMLFCLLIFILCVIIIKALASVFGAVRRIPVVGTLNAVLGAGVGVIFALSILFLLGLVGALFIAFSAGGVSWFNQEIIEKSVIYQFFFGFFHI